MNITRFPNGITNVEKSDVFAQCSQLDPTKYHTFFDDFNNYDANQWTYTDVGTPTRALIDSDGGRLLITNSAAISDYSINTLTNHGLLPKAGKKLFYKIKFQVNDSLNTVLAIGLNGTNNNAQFSKPNASTEISLSLRKSGVVNAFTTNTSLVDATDISLSYYYNGRKELYYYVDDQLKGIVDFDNFPLAVLAPRVSIINGNAVANYLSVDYILTAFER